MCYLKIKREKSKKESIQMKDNRPDPKPRKHPVLWQTYMWWEALSKLRTQSLNRMSAIDRGASAMNELFEMTVYTKVFSPRGKCTKDSVCFVGDLAKALCEEGAKLGLIWDWVTSIRGLAAGPQAAKLLALIDDIAKFATISKLWRYAGWAVIDGQIDRPTKGEKLHYNRQLKSCVWIIVDGFIKQRTPLYRDYYDSVKEDERRKHPTAICKKCGEPAVKKGLNWKCTSCGNGNDGYGLLYTDGHLHARAMRKVAKLFLSHLWVKWREYDGLLVSEPYIQAIGGHTNIIPPPEIGDGSGNGVTPAKVLCDDTQASKGIKDGDCVTKGG
jgi:ribosomal protein L37AE/L43A